MAAVYTPHSDSLAGRVVAYFRRLPDEELSTADIAIKWNPDQKNVPVQLAKAVEAGLLVRDGMIYSAGPNIGRIELTPTLLSSADQPSMKKPRVAPPVDIEAIEFEDTPEMAKAAVVRVHDRWVAKLKTMPAGKSFAVANVHGAALRAAVTDLRKLGWALSVVREGDEQVRVLCTKVPGAQP